MRVHSKELLPQLCSKERCQWEQELNFYDFWVNVNCAIDLGQVIISFWASIYPLFSTGVKSDPKPKGLKQHPHIHSQSWRSEVWSGLAFFWRLWRRICSLSFMASGGYPPSLLGGLQPSNLCFCHHVLGADPPASLLWGPSWFHGTYPDNQDNQCTARFLD